MISYTIPKNVDFTRIEGIQTILARNYVSEDEGLLTGFAIFPFSGTGQLQWPLLLLLGAVLLVWIVWYFNLFTQIRYVVYRLGRNERVHYVRMLVNEAEDELSAARYEKAELLYREIRMTYDALAQLAQNDLYEDVMRLVHAMDAYYFNMVMIELDAHLKAADLESAIASYEKLVGTFERLDEERQQQLIQTVMALARRLGVGA